MIEICCDVGRESQEGFPTLESSERSLLISGNTIFFVFLCTTEYFSCFFLKNDLNGWRNFSNGWAQFLNKYVLGAPAEFGRSYMVMTCI